MLALDPPHVSAYALTIEAGHAARDADPIVIPTTTTRPTSTRWSTTLLAAAGLENYEISNWARPGHECRHNLLYWRQQNYRGFGCAAHSHDDGRRWWNVRTPDRYIELVGSRRSRPRRRAKRSTPRHVTFERLELHAAHA